MHILILAFIPTFILSLYIYCKDANKEPLDLLAKTFGFGIFSTLAVLMEHTLIEDMLGLPISENVASRAFISAALLEEGTKFLFIYYLIWKSPEFDERFDGIVYSCILGLGFAFFENIIYLGSVEDFMSVAVGRAIFATPAHFLFAVVMGYGFGMAKFSQSDHTRKYLISGLVGAIILHGTYDYLLMYNSDITDNPIASGGLMLLFYIFDFIMWKIGLKRIKTLKSAQQ